VVDKSKLPGDLWVRMMWTPKEPAGIQERPIALIGDRRRWLIGLTPTILGFLLLIVLALIRAPLLVLILPMALAVVGARYATGGQAGFYEVRDDGSLGDFLGRKAPLGLREMRRTKS
jgi:hypothetical protein